MRQTPLPVPALPPQPAWARALCGETPLPEVPLLAPDAGAMQRQVVTEPLAWATLRGFLGCRAARYSGGISSPVTAFRAGSRLSVHLAWGTVSARAVQHETQRRLTELTGRHFPGSPCAADGTAGVCRAAWVARSFRAALGRRAGPRVPPAASALYEGLPCAAGDEAEERLSLLLAGQTGFPLVDACLRCAAATGFLELSDAGAGNVVCLSRPAFGLAN